MVYALHEVANQSKVTDYFRVDNITHNELRGKNTLAEIRPIVTPKPRLGTKVLRTSDQHNIIANENQPQMVIKRTPEDESGKSLKRSRILDMPNLKFRRTPAKCQTSLRSPDSNPGPVRVSHEMFREDVGPAVRTRSRTGIATNPYVRRRYSAELVYSQSVRSFTDSQRLSQYSQVTRSSMTTSTSMTSTKSSSSYSFQQHQNRKAFQMFQGLRRSARKTLASMQKAVRRSIDLAEIKQASQKLKHQYGRVVELHRPDVNIPFGLFISKIHKSDPSNFIVTRLTMVHSNGLSLGDEIIEINNRKCTELTLDNVREEMRMKRHLKLLISR